LITIGSHESAIHGFKRMLLEMVSSIAVINHETNELIEILSLRDLSIIGSKLQNWHRIWLDVSAYKQLVRQQYPAKVIPTENNIDK
jgi:hypothetical protein